MMFVDLAVIALCVAVYLAGWMVSTKRHLHRRMMEEVCARCGRSRDSWYHEGDRAYPQGPHEHHFRSVPRGAYRERDTYDVTESMRMAIPWPLWALAAGFCAIGRATVRRVSARIPLTAPELERRIRERAAAIDAMEKDIK